MKVFNYVDNQEERRIALTGELYEKGYTQKQIARGMRTSVKKIEEMIKEYNFRKKYKPLLEL